MLALPGTLALVERSTLVGSLLVMVTTKPPGGAGVSRCPMPVACMLKPTVIGLTMMFGAVTVAVSCVAVAGAMNPLGCVTLTTVVPGAAGRNAAALLLSAPPEMVTGLFKMMPVVVLELVMVIDAEIPPRKRCVVVRTLPKLSSCARVMTSGVSTAIGVEKFFPLPAEVPTMKPEGVSVTVAATPI